MKLFYFLALLGIYSAVFAAFRRCGELRRDRDLERHNNGVTIILL